MKTKTRKAAPNERTIELKIRFFTNKLAKGNGHVVPKHAHGDGMVSIVANPTHGIMKNGAGVPFHSVAQIAVAVERVLSREGVTIHPGALMRYVEGAGSSPRS
jgi:hypothetical protein